MNTPRHTSFDQRLVRYEQLHEILPDHFRAFIAAGQIRGNCRILDCGCGYGSVTREILKATAADRARGETTLTIDLIDDSAVQLDGARWELAAWNGSPGAKLDFIRGVFPDDLRAGPGTYDVIACKMVLHEVLKERQSAFVGSVYEHLKLHGRFIFWDLCLPPDLASFYRAVFKKKDVLAGYDTLVERRTFMTEPEFVELFHSSPFRAFQIVAEIAYRFDTLKRLEPELKGDLKAFAEWQNFIRASIADLDPSAVEKLMFEDDGDSISFNVRKIIAVAQRRNARSE